MVRTLLFIVLILCSAKTFAQTEEYVEILVEDSLQLEPEEFIYTIQEMAYTTDTIDIIDEARSVASAITNKPSVKDRVRTVVKNLKLDTLADKKHYFHNSVYSDDGVRVIHIKITSRKQLDTLLKNVQQIEGAMGFVSEVRSSQEEAARIALLKKLLSKAQTEATTIAILSNKVLGKILMVKENMSENSVGGWTSYPPLSALGNWSKSTDSPDKVIIWRSITVRIGWK